VDFLGDLRPVLLREGETRLLREASLLREGERRLLREGDIILPSREGLDLLIDAVRIGDRRLGDLTLNLLEGDLLSGLDILNL
jgi:hypothetical protein